MDIKPIRTDDDLAAAHMEIETLWNAQPGTPEGDRLDVLITLAEAYERATSPMTPPDPIEAILFRLDQMGSGRAALKGLIGGSGRVAEVLNRVRPLTLPMIRTLSEHLGISADILVRPYPLREQIGAE
ncbi:transcriptional regulator [Nitrospirillum sp. BR 11164]|uniref:helix-turn-helix domain-containing protein n=1 Tax=Nitrospirillum sp. BR 11164 TaxID=3104324 RepID=UPI002AFE4E14|nr:transcriptional regulator [Nitrospirillum sp. BR 11164]MEA1652005.1 transcriptional regulator [Nitrospirillum sp. BR 11164]